LQTQATEFSFSLLLPSGQKLTLGLLATISLKVVPFCVYPLFPVLLPFFKYIPEFVFCEGGLHCLRFCISHLSCVKMAAFRFFSITETEVARGQVRGMDWVGDNSHVASGQKFPSEKESVRQCIVVMQQPVILS
jgi:hypothetical protein